MTKTNLPTEIEQMIEQLGGARIFAMAFSSCTYSVAGDDSQRPSSAGVASLSLEIARPLRKSVRGAAKVIITLEGNDTYTVKLWKAPTAAESRAGEFEGHYVEQVILVYADNLREVVESVTGLALSLGTMRAG